ncbi:hypothetical protein [Devosia submarina]|uniref:hypothetical protein n=1 Tax=Devosia submarina TaxID=1173082 RepID=UPI000D39211F|nr:hypothetical protein [Devosia submarina]
MSDKNSAIDWASIRLEFEAGKQSIRAIAKWYKISDAAIRKQAKKHGWKVANQQPSSQATASANPPVVAAASTEVTKVEEVISRGRNIADRLLDELGAETLHMGEMEVIIQLNETDPERIQAIKQAVSLPTRAKTLQTIALALKTMGETATEVPRGKKAQRQARAEEVSTGGNKFAVPSAPKLAVDNTR